MDISAIAAAVVALLSPYLAKAGEEVAKQASNAAWEKMAEIHQMIKARFKKEKGNSPTKTLKEFEKDPENHKVAMQKALIEILGKDPDLATSLLNMVQETKKADPEFVTQIFGGEVGHIFNVGNLEGGINIGERPRK